MPFFGRSAASCKQKKRPRACASGAGGGASSFPGVYHAISPAPCSRKNAFTCENGREPKKPR